VRPGRGRYYHLWQEKRAPLEALRQAQFALYRHRERIQALARERGPDFANVAARRSPTRLWACFVLSGAGQ
jgi:hypothetical protein